MITDHISNAALYYPISERLKMALQYLADTDFSKLAPGRYDQDGDNVYAMVQEYSTKPVADCALEAHKKYIDVQFMIDGEECIGYEPMANQEISEPYHENEDYWLFNGNPSLVKYTKGMFAVLYPQDLHMPKVISSESMDVRKVVVKVKL
jgi:YhcH/YjgK/YiaL family protein